MNMLKNRSFIQLLMSGMMCLLIVGTGQAAPLSISNVPLYLTARADPNVLINMSVETPMGGAAYNDNVGIPTGCTGRATVDGTSNIGTCYFPATTYLGYFDPNKCYVYDSTNGRFNPSGATNSTNHDCTSKWSGNFLNWVSMAAIDEFIWTMTGGNRVTDTTALTVIRRARKQNNNSWFPRKALNATNNVAPSTVTPYGDATLFFHNTDFGMDVGTTFNKATSTGDTPDRGSYNIQIRVCDPSQTLETNCVAYGSSPVYYKPEGLIQRNASQKRFALTSYTLDNAQSRDGGVLRSKMKYVGPNRPIFGGGGTETNPEKEYSTDGLLINNPDSASGSLNSGVINYINKFSDPGYKSYDPIGELFYESLRYFKKLGPTPECSSGITRDSTDTKTGGFWFYNTTAEWGDPIQYPCQKNFIIGINDANPWLDKKLPGTFFTSPTLIGAGGTSYTLTASDYGEPSNPDSSINVRTLTNRVGDLEGLTGTSQCVGGGANTYDNSATNKTITALGEVMGTCPYPPKQNSYYIAGLAYYANTTDIRPDLPAAYNGKQQTVSTFMIDTQEYSSSPLTGRMNMLWLAGKYGGFIDSDGDGTPMVVSTPTSDAEWDADGDGQPDNYVLATQPQKLIDGLSSAFVDIDNRTSTAAAVSLNSSSLNASTRIYQAQFNSADWTGNLLALPISTTGVIGALQWEAKVRLNLQNWDTGRNIYTRNTTRGVRFKWPVSPASPTSTEIDASQVASLKTGSVTDSVGQQRLEFLRGNHGQESVVSIPRFRNRNGTKLGDLIYSTPIYVGAPPYLPDLETTTHASFRASAAITGRAPMVYIGGNDGMLHGFQASNGDEKMAYIPNVVFPNLHLLTSPSYVHRSFVDSPATVGDVFGTYTGCATSPCWRTVVVGGLGGGGKGIFALDVTNPNVFTETDANANILSLWEFTDTSDADLGFTFGQPVIARMADGTWRAIFGNGYNSTSEKSVLYLVNIANVADVRKIILDDTSGAGNGLSAPAAVDVNGDYIVDYIYAGDLQGNLWKVDVTSTTNTNWVSFYRDSGGTPPRPLFKAENPTGTAQPITSRPEVGSNSYGGGSGYMIYFGTGKYLENSDKSNVNIQTFYGIWDKPLGNNVGASPAVATIKLMPQTIGTAQVISDLNKDGDTTDPNETVDVRTITNDPINNWGDTGTCNTTSSGRCMGWKVSLPAGERVVANSQLLSSGSPPRVIFTTLIPSDVPCSFGGSSWLMELNPANGGQLSGVIFDVNGDGIFDSRDLVGGTTSPAGIQTNLGITPEPAILHDPGNKQDLKISTGTSGIIKPIANNAGTRPPGRQSWRQLR